MSKNHKFGYADKGYKSGGPRVLPYPCEGPHNAPELPEFCDRDRPINERQVAPPVIGFKREILNGLSGSKDIDMFTAQSPTKVRNGSSLASLSPNGSQYSSSWSTSTMSEELGMTANPGYPVLPESYGNHANRRRDGANYPNQGHGQRQRKPSDHYKGGFYT